MPLGAIGRSCKGRRERGRQLREIRSFFLDGDVLTATAQAALKGADLQTVWSRYQTCKHHWSVAFRAWRPFDAAGIGDERLWHGYYSFPEAYSDIADRRWCDSHPSLLPIESRPKCRGRTMLARIESSPAHSDHLRISQGQSYPSPKERIVRASG
jgi:hypothetical protein